MLHPIFWEVGASGKVYSRELVIDTVEKRFLKNTEADISKWVISNFECRQLSNDTYMVTSVLEQESRRTRRLTIWRKAAIGWQVAYYQVTTISE